MCVTYAFNACVLICKHKNPKIMASPEGKKIHKMKKYIPEAQDGDDKIQRVLTLVCDDSAKVTCTTATIKSDNFDEKTKNSIAPNSENGANNDVGRVETAENSTRGVVGITITTDDYVTVYVPMYVFHVLHRYN